MKLASAAFGTGAVFGFAVSSTMMLFMGHPFLALCISLPGFASAVVTYMVLRSLRRDRLAQGADFVPNR